VFSFFNQFELKLFYILTLHLSPYPQAGVCEKKLFFHVTIVLERNIFEKLFTYLEDFKNVF